MNTLQMDPTEVGWRVYTMPAVNLCCAYIPCQPCDLCCGYNMAAMWATPWGYTMTTAGIAWIFCVYVPFSTYCCNFMCPSMWNRKKCCLNVPKDQGHIVRLSLPLCNPCCEYILPAMWPMMWTYIMSKRSFICGYILVTNPYFSYNHVINAPGAALNHDFNYSQIAVRTHDRIISLWPLSIQSRVGDNELSYLNMLWSLIPVPFCSAHNSHNDPPEVVRVYAPAHGHQRVKAIS